MARIGGIDVESTEGYVRRVLAAQAKAWGAPLNNHVIYARLPALFKAVRGMWTALGADELLDDSLVSLVNRRVAFLNGCAF